MSKVSPYELGEQLIEELSKLRVNQNDDVTLSLIEQGADLTLCDAWGATALHLAVAYEVPVVVKALLDAGANAQCKNHAGRTPLFNAAFNPDEDVMEILLRDINVDIECLCDGVRTVLHLVAEIGDGDKLVLLLRAGADVTCQNDIGQTALDVVYKNRKASVITALNKWQTSEGLKEDILADRSRQKIYRSTKEGIKNDIPRKKFGGFKPKP